VKRALELNAAAVILCHNHPSGITEASKADISITQQLISSLNLVSVRVLDHIIVGDGAMSMTQVGYIKV
jgi:DNA repair protein RadC